MVSPNQESFAPWPTAKHVDAYPSRARGRLLPDDGRDCTGTRVLPGPSVVGPSRPTKHPVSLRIEIPGDTRYYAAVTTPEEPE